MCAHVRPCAYAWACARMPVRARTQRVCVYPHPCAHVHFAHVCFIYTAFASATSFGITHEEEGELDAG